MKTSILTVLLIFGFAAINHAKPINDIYSLKEPSAANTMYVTGNPSVSWEIAIKTSTDSNDITPDENPRAKNNTNTNINDNNSGSGTEKVMYEDLATRLNDFYKDEMNTVEKQDFDFVICDKDQGSQFYVPVKISPANNIKSSNQDGLTVPGSSL